VALALAAVGLLPVAIASFGLVDVNREAIFDQVLQTHAVAARTAAARVSAFVAMPRALAAGAAANPALADPGSPEAQALLASSLASWADLGVLAVAVVDETGEEVIRAQLKGEEARRRAEAALRAPGRGEVVVVPGERPSLRVEAPLAGGGGGLRLAVEGSPLADALRPAELGDQADLVLAGPEGVVLGSVTSLDGFPPEVARNALSGRVVGAVRYVDPRGRLILGAYAPVEGGPWSVISRQPTAVAEAVARRMRRQSLLAIGAALLLILALSAVAWASLVRPIRGLLRAQRELAGIQAGTIEKGDEIQALRNVFDVLRRSLSERRALDDVFLGRYQIVEHLGTGAMGSVFRGWDPKLQRPVALKTVRLGEILEDKRRKLVETLLREAVTVARLNHPNVVAVYDLEDAPEGAFVAMELVDGPSLEWLLWRRERLGPEAVIPLGAAVARGLAAAHAREIVHRDVKPGNVLLGRDGSIKVSDFGIADLIASASEKKDSVFGTPGYMPPEALRGAGHGAAGDLFALGVILYECLTGTRPFVGRNVAEIARATLASPVRPLARQVPGLPPDLELLVLRLLDREPGNRPPGAAEAAAELERMAAERGLRWVLDEGKAGDVEGLEPAVSQWVRTPTAG
jgi:HAMP domain-containing protein